LNFLQLKRNGEGNEEHELALRLQREVAFISVYAKRSALRFEVVFQVQQNAVGHFRKKQVRDQQLMREMNEQRKGIVVEQSAHIDE